MIVDTTINVRTEIYNSIHNLSFDTGLSQNSIYNQLLRIFYKNTMPKYISPGRIKYQERDKDQNWDTFHICYSYDMYEKSIDMKKFCKMSVSHIIEYSYKHYLYEAMKELIDNTDNYSLNYFSISTMKNGIFTYTIYWGYPEEETIKSLMENKTPD